MAAPEPIHMPPQIWGPIFWATMHIASLGYSDTPTERQKKKCNSLLRISSRCTSMPYLSQTLRTESGRDANKGRCSHTNGTYTLGIHHA